MMMESTTQTESENEPKGQSGCIIRGLEWLTVKLRLTEEGATPLNWNQILLIFSCLFSSSITLTFLFPFLPEMILHLGYAENEKGTYGGMIGSAVFAGRILSSFIWGWLADVRGRKCVLLCSILLTGLTAGLFGFSVNIPIAIVLRFLCGFLNGTVPTAKAALYDVTDNSNQAVGMSMLSISWGLGLVVGPFLGGVLATPCTKWPEMCSEESLLGQFPFLLPSVCITAISFSVFLLIWFKFDETVVSSNKSKRNIETNEATSQAEDDGIEGFESRKVHMTVPLRKEHLLRSLSESTDHKYRSANFLSRSVISLNPEAELPICLGKEVLQKQNSVKESSHIHLMSLSQPELSVRLGKELVPSHIGDGLISKSVNHLPKSCQHINLPAVAPSSNQHANLSNSDTRPIYRPNGKNPYHHNGGTVILTQPDTTLQMKDETKQQNALDDPNNQPLLSQPFEHEEEMICECADKCFQLQCCSCCTGSSIHKLLRMSDVWSSIMMYTVISVVTIGVDDVFPVFASTRTDYGGLGFSTNEIGLALGMATLPILFVQLKLYPFLVGRLGIRKTFMAMVLICMVACQTTPMLRALNNHPTWLWVCLVLNQVPLKIAINCCFASTSLLINNSAPPELAGQVNGLSMTTTAIGRSIAPIMAGVMYSWSVTYGQFIGAPFDTGFTFFVMGILYGVGFVQCMFINPNLDKQKK